MVVDTQATPVMAQGVIDRIRSVTDKPIEYVTLSHYHAVRVLGASAYTGDAYLQDWPNTLERERVGTDWTRVANALEPWHSCHNLPKFTAQAPARAAPGRSCRKAGARLSIGAATILGDIA